MLSHKVIFYNKCYYELCVGLCSELYLKCQFDSRLCCKTFVARQRAISTCHRARFVPVDSTRTGQPVLNGPLFST